MRVVIDRFEGNYAVVELDDLSIVNVPKSLFKGAKEGDIIDIIINKEESDKRKGSINKLIDNLFINKWTNKWIFLFCFCLNISSFYLYIYTLNVCFSCFFV